MKTVAIIQARLGSTRLPGKVLFEVAGRSMIGLMIERLRRARTLDEIVLATGDGPMNNALGHAVAALGIPVFRGPEGDVLARFAGAAQAHGADVIVRLTGDCPLMDPEVVDLVVRTRAEGGYDYVTNVKPPTWPDGMDVSVFTREVLAAAQAEARLPSDREHVVPWMWRQSSLEGGTRLTAENVAADRDLSGFRWTVDEAPDFEFLSALAGELGPEGMVRAGYRDILGLLERRPDIQALNQGCVRDAGYAQSLAGDTAATEPGTRKVEEFYSGVALTYNQQYDPKRIHTNKEYPANFFRLRILLARMREAGTRKVLDMGLGEGTPAVHFAALGAEVCGFDYTPEMVDLARENFSRNGLDPDRVIRADVQDRETFAPLLKNGPFDAVTCLGVMPHVEDDLKVLGNIRSCLGCGGRVFVSFRNSVFSMFTMNRYTHDFIVDDMLEGVPKDIRDAVSENLKGRMAMDKPPVRMRTKAGGVGYDTIPARFHNPFKAPALFSQAGFGDVTLHWYHFHPAQPYLEGECGPAEFRKAAVALEGLSRDWRGHFLCSAFVVEAVAK